MSSIFEITGEYLELLDKLEESGGELTPELEEMLEINDEEFEDKINSYGVVIRKLRADIEVAKAEISRINDIKKSKEGAIKRMIDVVDGAMKIRELDKFETPTARISYRRSKRVDIIDLDSIPEQYKNVSYSADKALIKEEIEGGGDVPGAEVNEYFNIQFK